LTRDDHGIGSGEHTVTELSVPSVEEALRNVLGIMEQAGFKVNQEVKVVVDERLSFMGYASRRSQSHVIVISGFAVKSSMLEGLLAHELSHIYRNITNHPSHREPLIASLARSFINSHNLDQDYEKEVLHQAMNHIQDLYADDIAFEVLKAYGGVTSPLEQLGEFFLGWIKEEPARGGARERDEWVNASILLNNCFAISNMERHKIKGTQIERARLSNNRFLNQITPSVVMRFDYFNKFMVGLKEDISEAEFGEQMREYLRNFFDIVRIV